VHWLYQFFVLTTDRILLPKDHSFLSLQLLTFSALDQNSSSCNITIVHLVVLGWIDQSDFVWLSSRENSHNVCTGPIPISSEAVCAIHPNHYSISQGVVLATGLSNLQEVQVWTGKTVRFCSRPIQNTELPCLCGVSTWTGYKPVVFWPGLSYSRASFSSTHNFGSN